MDGSLLAPLAYYHVTDTGMGDEKGMACQRRRCMHLPESNIAKKVLCQLCIYVKY